VNIKAIKVTKLLSFFHKLRFKFTTFNNVVAEINCYLNLFKLFFNYLFNNKRINNNHDNDFIL